MGWGWGWGGWRKNCHNECRSTTKHARANRNCEHKYLCALTETDGNHLIRPNISALTWKEQKKRGWSLERPSIVAHRRWETDDPAAPWGHELGTAIHVTDFATLYWFPMQVATGLWRAARSSDKVAKLAIPHCLFCHAALAAVKPHSEAKPLGAPSAVYICLCVYRAIYLNSRPHHKSHTSKKENTFNSTSTKTEMKMTPGNTELPLPVSKFTCG